jgi:hypothetical protein
VLSQLINRPCTITRRSESGVEDAYGNDVPEETVVETVCELQQQRRDEPDQQGEVSDALWIAFFLPGTAVHTGDVLTVDGEQYEVVGDPWHPRNPRTQAEGQVEATLRRTAGSDDEVGS